MSHDHTHLKRRWLLPGLGLAAGAASGIAAARQWRRTAQPPAFRLAVPKPGTAVITGASSGIGAAFACQLAGAGYHLLLVARRAERLETLAAELRQQAPVEVAVLAADLADPAEVERVEQRIRGTDDLSVLINNAGFGTTGHFAEIDLDKQLAMIHVHVLASVRLSRAALPGMLERQRGALINVSSIAAFFTGPNAVTYSATKRYLNVFSEALQSELTDTGVQVQALCPGYTYTEFHDTPEYADFDRNSTPRSLWMSADEVAAASLAALKRPEVIVVPGLPNRFIVWMAGKPLGLAWIRRVRRRLLAHRR